MEFKYWLNEIVFISCHIIYNKGNRQSIFNKQPLPFQVPHLPLLLVLKCPLNMDGGPYLGRTEVALTFNKITWVRINETQLSQR